MLGGTVFATVLSFLNSAVNHFIDPREGKNKHYGLHNIAMSAFAVFFCQSPSFLAFQRLMQQAHGMNNAEKLFGVDDLPTDNQIRNILDTVDPSLLCPVFHDSFRYLKERGILESFRSFANTLLVPLDGTGYFYSESIHCPSCRVTHHDDGRVSYSHQALMPAVVKPHRCQVIPLEPEFIHPREGHDRQDCEREAAKRWIKSAGSHYSPQAITLLGDDIYACQPIISLIGEEEMDFIFVAKSSSHKHLYQEVDSLQQLGEVKELRRKHWTGKQHQQYSYRFINDVDLKAGKESMKVNWLELRITNEKGKTIRYFSFVTNHFITLENIEALVEAGRCRWKIENEDINTLKTKGYHFEHNFGHGKSFLAQTLLSLNIIAFLFHTVLEVLDENCAWLRKTLPRRDTFFQHIAALTQYLCFASWQSLLQFMIRGLKEGPRPPPEPFAVID
jgi:hypothetical protein